MTRRFLPLLHIGSILRIGSISGIVRAAALLAAQGLLADEATAPPSVTGSAEGFYKDLFIDGGARLSSRNYLHAAKSLGLDYEYYAGHDETRQSQIVSGNEDDFNGALLYPDGQPRFRLIYVHGGGATAHGKTLQHAGRQAFRTFYYNGGSYCGSCAGAFLPGANTDRNAVKRLGYLHIYPYNTLNTGMKKERVGHRVPENSPLWTYRDFGADRRVDDIYHNNGNWMHATEGAHLKDTEILALYDKPDRKVHQGAAIWAHKQSSNSGRIVMIGSHPEGAKSGEKLALTEACLLYALAGVAPPAIKGVLKPGKARVMHKRSSDRDPAHTRIGDRQYHHFTIDVPPGGCEAEIKLTGEDGHLLNLYLGEEGPAFASCATFANRKPGANKQLRARLSAGTWHVGVQCTSTVRTEERVEQVGKYTSKFHRYSGDLSVLNGVAYTIGWTATGTGQGN